MKRKLLALFMVSSCFVGSMFAQEEAAAPVAQSGANYAVGTVLGGPEDVNRFSFGIKGGLDYLRWSDQKVQPAFGGFVELTVNPLWGLGLEYMYLMNDRETLGGGAPGELKSTVQDITLFGSVNVSNIIAKYRNHGWQKLNLYANGGAGVSIYDWSYKGISGSGDNGAKPVFVAGAALEYNVAKWLGLGLEGQYRFHTDATFVGKGNGGRSMAGANIVARFKLGGEKNVRNIALVNYDPQVEVSTFDANPLIEKVEKQLAENKAQTEKQLAAQNAELQKTQSQVKELQDTLKAMKERARARVRHTPTQEEEKIIKTAFSQLEFESGKDIIMQSSYASLDGLATLLLQRPDWSVVLKGYTDSSGNADKNLQLSKDRAFAVKTYLVNKGVPATAIQTFGFGAADPIATNSTAAGRAKNRRVEIELFSKQ